MVNYRTYNTLKLTTGQTGSLSSAWGVLPGQSAAGTIRLEGFGTGSGLYPTDSHATISIADLQVGVPFPCYVRSVEVSGGTVYILA